MKINIATLIATTFLTTGAYAGTTMYHSYNEGLRDIHLYNACVTSTEVRSISPQAVCTELVEVTPRAGESEYKGTEWVCKKWGTASYAYPREFLRSDCEKYIDRGELGQTCAKLIEVSDYLPKSIPVFVVTSNGESDNFPGVKHMYTFPRCK